jgi:hypothetical protein
MRHPSAPLSFWLFVSVLVAGFSCAAAGGGVDRAPTGCAFKVVATRPARVGEHGFEDAHPLLRDPENSWVVPGPNGMRAVVKSDSARKPALFVSDSMGALRRVPGVWASGPVRWSPDGTRLAVVSWQSREKPWIPIVAILMPPSIIMPTPVSMGTGLKWAPNGKWVAVDGRAPASARSFLWVMSSETGQCRVLDTLGVFANYEFGWSPDSRWLVVSRPSELSSHEDITRADLWLFGLDGTRCRLVNTPREIERNPRWVDGHRIIYRRETPGFTEPPREVVIELHRRARREEGTQ